MRLKRPKKEVLGQRIDILGVKVDDISPENAENRILELATRRNERGHYVVTVNSEFVMLARRNREFQKILKEADLALADGMGVVFAKRILGGKVQRRITGVDLVEKLCAKSAKSAIRIGFLGGFDGVANNVAKRQKLKNPGLKVVFAKPGDPTMRHDSRLKKALDGAGRIDILFVAFGMGRQEFWIRKNQVKVNVGVFIGVGGALDYLSSVKKRAPKLLQDVGFEWLWRLFWEPARIWRMRVLPAFPFLVFWQFCRLFFKINRKTYN